MPGSRLGSHVVRFPPNWNARGSYLVGILLRIRQHKEFGNLCTFPVLLIFRGFQYAFSFSKHLLSSHQTSIRALEMLFHFALWATRWRGS